MLQKRKEASVITGRRALLLEEQAPPPINTALFQAEIMSTAQLGSDSEYVCVCHMWLEFEIHFKLYWCLAVATVVVF